MGNTEHYSTRGSSHRVPSPPHRRRRDHERRSSHRRRTPSVSPERRQERRRKDRPEVRVHNDPASRDTRTHDFNAHLNDVRARHFQERNEAFRPAPYLQPDYEHLFPGYRAEYSFNSGNRPHTAYRNEERDRYIPTPIPKAPNSAPSVASPSVASPSNFNSVRSGASGVLGDQKYQHTALQQHEFRLLKLFPERKTMIKCEIIHASFDDPPPYVAISYAWGDAGDTKKIELEGAKLHITVSLHGALEALRQKSESLLVWVDALCIDQSNADERPQQVRLMTSIYSNAQSVAVWLGPEADGSSEAVELLCVIADKANSREEMSRFIRNRVSASDITAVVSLFERDFWNRLWVVQEMSNARSVVVHCGSMKAGWEIYQRAAEVFSNHRADIDQNVYASRKELAKHSTSPYQFNHTQVLVYQGPNSLPDISAYKGLGEAALLEVLRACRRKVASDARDKLYGILGTLSLQIRMDFRVDYKLSVKDVYTEIVDYLLLTTGRLDVICDAIHFPTFTSPANLPSFVPDWSHMSPVAAMGHRYKFLAAKETRAKCKFLHERMNKLEVSAIYLDTIKTNGVAVGTLCTLADYLMAFLNWWAILMATLDKASNDRSMEVQNDFCRALSLNQIPEAWERSNQWMNVTYHVFATLLHQRLPYLPLHRNLHDYIDKRLDLGTESRRQFLQKHYGDRMMGRSFCITEEKRIGMGSGFMLPGDIVVVPFGCSTPVLLRQEGSHGEYRFVGDVYIHGYMYGMAIDDWRAGRREERKYVLR